MHALRFYLHIEQCMVIKALIIHIKLLYNVIPVLKFTKDFIFL